MIKRAAAIIALMISMVLLAGGLLFLCAAVRQPSRLFVGMALLVIGGVAAAWGGLTLRRLRELDPGHLDDRITALARAGGHAEVTLSQVVAELRVPDEAALAALASLESRGQCHRKNREGRECYVFPGLKEIKVVRRCAFCGSTLSVKTPRHKCPNCGGDLEVVHQ